MQGDALTLSLMDNEHVKICVSLCAPTLAELETACIAAARLGDVIELRLDCLREPELARLTQIARLTGKPAPPVILTLRAPEQGGFRQLTREQRMQFWQALFGEFAAAYLDLELDLVQSLSESPLAAPDWSRVICSHHDFKGVPNDLIAIYETMAATPATILKIAVQANDIVDCLPVFDLLSRARLEGRKLIAIAMGSAGIATRILGPAWGSHLTYAAFDDESATASGQITAVELRETYRLERINSQTAVTGIIGWPVGHSLSPSIQNAAFADLNIDSIYLPFEVRALKPFLERMVHPRTREIDWNLRGLSVTAPHKRDVLPFLDWIDPAAAEIGAVNTIVIDGDLLLGYNTDAGAVLKPVAEKLGDLKDARCAVIGAGGAANAILWSLRNEGAKATVFARDQEKGSALAEKFAAGCEPLAQASFKGFDLVINATPLGTRGALEGQSPAGAEQLRGAGMAYDLVYNPSETMFLGEARTAGCETMGGLAMLVLQAAQQFTLWTGAAAPLAVMQHAAEEISDF